MHEEMEIEDSCDGDLCPHGKDFSEFCGECDTAEYCDDCKDAPCHCNSPGQRL